MSSKQRHIGGIALSAFFDRGERLAAASDRKLSSIAFLTLLASLTYSVIKWRIVAGSGTLWGKMSMFRGVSELSLDSKGRVAIPARYRELLIAQMETPCIITIDTEERCLLIYPLKVWEGIEKQIQALPSFDLQARRVQRLLIGHATEAQIDTQGRLLVPPPLRSYAQFQKAVVLMGQGQKLELWDAVAWYQARDKWLQSDETKETLSASLLSISL